MVAYVMHDKCYETIIENLGKQRILRKDSGFPVEKINQLTKRNDSLGIQLI
jgi:hypothetical protein